MDTDEESVVSELKVSPSEQTDVLRLDFEGRQCRLRETTFQLLTILGTLPKC